MIFCTCGYIENNQKKKKKKGDTDPDYLCWKDGRQVPGVERRNYLHQTDFLLTVLKDVKMFGFQRVIEKSKI